MLLVTPKLDRRGLRLLAEHLEALRPKNKPTMETVAAATGRCPGVQGEAPQIQVNL